MASAVQQLLSGYGAVTYGDANTTLLLSFDTGSTIVDNGVNAFGGWTLNSPANVNSTQVKFGVGALDVTSNGVLSRAGNAAFAFGTGDFTVDFWAYVSTYSAIDWISIQGASGTSWSFATSGGNVCWVTPGVAIRASKAPPTANAWHHFAAERLSGNVTIYIDGVGGTPGADATNYSNSSSSLLLGANSSFNGASTGWMDEVRISNVARYGGNFTPPSAPY